MVGRNPASNFKESKKINPCPTCMYLYITLLLLLYIMTVCMTSSLSGSVGINDVVNDENVNVRR